MRDRQSGRRTKRLRRLALLLTAVSSALWAQSSGTRTSLVEYPVPTAAGGPNWITAGPDGAMWFAELSANAIGRVTTSGAVTEYAIPSAVSGTSVIAAGPDGALWFAEGVA